MLAGFARTELDPAMARALRLEIEEFHAEYCAALDEDRIADWPSFFAEDAIYRITGRENADSGLPVGLVYCEGKGMLRDRALAIARTEMFAPRYLQHHVTNLRILGVADAVVAAQANYLVLQTLVDERTTLHQAGRYYDRFARIGGRLLLRERHCVYDTLLIDNTLVMPI
ncbi:MAG TPA: aromatic-ring-hydroxylating dioxygenase subunit beta [Stellaceae bacterium]|nr:aromatic-ring-hydroxylating dioxygenase subunit beta [Stellaceae bacterium]